jgi:hypothetical protein
MQDELPDFKEINRLELRPDDIIVVRYEIRLRPVTVDAIKAGLRRMLGVPNKIVILDSGAQVDILTPSESAARIAEAAFSPSDAEHIAEAMRLAEENPGRVVSTSTTWAEERPGSNFFTPVEVAE